MTLTERYEKRQYFSCPFRLFWWIVRILKALETVQEGDGWSTLYSNLLLYHLRCYERIGSGVIEGASTELTMTCARWSWLFLPIRTARLASGSEKAFHYPSNLVSEGTMVGMNGVLRRTPPILFSCTGRLLDLYVQLIAAMRSSECFEHGALLQC